MTKLLTCIAIALLILGCKTPEARKPISVKTGSFIDESVKRSKKLYALEQAHIEKLLNKRQGDAYIASQSGFWYYYNTRIENDTLITPSFGDLVNYNYNIKALDGSLIYSKEELKTQNYPMDKGELFTGLREGLKLMKTGETVTFIFPSQKAYGYYGDAHKIGSNTPLICEVTVNSITQNQSN